MDDLLFDESRLCDSGVVGIDVVPRGMMFDSIIDVINDVIDSSGVIFDAALDAAFDADDLLGEEGKVSPRGVIKDVNGVKGSSLAARTFVEVDEDDDNDDAA